MATEDGRLTAAELATLLDISPAGVSGAVRYLTQVRMIRRERERGSRRDVYVVMDDAWHDMLMQQRPDLRADPRGPRRGPGALGDDTRAGERMQLSVEFLEFVTARDGRHRRALGGVQGRPRLTASAGIRPRATACGAAGSHPEPTGDAGRLARMPEGGPGRRRASE